MCHDAQVGGRRIVKIIRYWVLGSSLVLLTVGCKAERTRPALMLSDSMGVEIVTLENLPSILDPKFEWRTEVQIEIPTQGDDPSGPPLIYQPKGILPLTGNSILVFDEYGETPLIILNAETGAVAARFGRRGGGPDEIQGIPSIWFEADGRIRVADMVNLKLLTYSPTGEVLGRQPFIQDRLFRRDVVQSNAQGLVVEQWYPLGNNEWMISLGRLDPETGETRRFVSLPAPPVIGRIQTGRPIWTAVKGGLVTSRSDKAEFEVFGEEGALVRMIRLPLSRRHLTQAEIDWQIRKFGAIARSLEVGPMAIFNEMYAFGDSIFGLFQSDLWRAAEDPEIPEDQRIWRLISVSGNYMGAFPKPDDFTPLWIGDRTMWGVALDSTGIPWIQRRRLIPPEAFQEG